MHPASLPIGQLLSECTMTRGRRSGPGGQHRNKVETAIRIRHTDTGIQAEATERRSQAKNRSMAIFRLRVRLALRHRNALPNDYGLSDLWKSRCRTGRITVNTSHDDFPAILAEALDVLMHFSMDVKTASKLLGCSSSQLVRLLKLEPEAIHHLNQERKGLGLSPLR